MRRNSIAPVLALLLVVSTGATATADVTKLDPLARRSLSMANSGTPIATMRRLSASVNAERELDVFITGDVTRGELEAAGARVRTELPGLFTAYVPASAIEAVSDLPGVRQIRGASRVKPNLDQSVPTTGAPNLRGGAPTFTGLNGAGVIIGDVDTGVDYGHGDFQKPDGTSRILDIWDQTDLAGPNPSGFAYGSEWGSASLDDNTAREKDVDGHGTHVLGIAGGDGSQTGGSVPAFTYVGMAPQADLIMVKADFQSDATIIDGVSYVMNRATALGKNAVVNLSLGSLYGPKDGTSPFDLGVSALCGPGHIVVVSAGNDGNYPVHADITAPVAGSAVATLSVPTTQPGAYVGIDGYYPAAATLTLTVTTPGGLVIGPIALGSSNTSYPGTLTAAGYVYAENGAFLTATGDRQVYIELNVPNPNPTNANPTGTWQIQLSQPGTSNTHDETTENLSASQWSALTATPGTVSGAVTGSHLLISEVGMRGLNSATLTDSTEFLEVFNPTASSIDLSHFYLSDVNAYATLPVAGTINLAGINTDFAMKFPSGSSIAAGGVKVIAIDGGRYRRGTGTHADFMFFDAGGGATTAQAMTSVATNTGSGYPGFGSLTNAAEFVWLFNWDGASDVVCDVDLAYWGSTTGANAPSLKSASTCQDGPDAGSGTTCYAGDVGNPAGSLGRPLSVPASGNGTRQRVGPEGAESGGGNGCNLGGPPPTGSPAEIDLWMFASSEDATFVTGADPTHKLVSEPGSAIDVITVGAWVTKTSWIDCGGHNIGFVDPGVVGDLASFSSPGPTRDGRQKPDIAAPGMAIGSALTHDTTATCEPTGSLHLNDDSNHTIEAGTSMSAPHVTGAVALLLQKYGAMTPAQVKTLLFARALTDGFTGAVWNKDWGHGKLFLGDLTDPITQVVSPNGGEAVVVGNSTPVTWNASDAYQGVTSVDLELSRDDGSTWEPIATGQPNSGSYSWTVTGPATTTARVRVTARDAAGNAGQDLSDAGFTITTSLAAPASAVTDFALALPGSNPAHGAATVRYAVPRSSRVRVEVFDLQGRSVARLANGLHGAGQYEVRFDGGADKRSGIFFVRLTSGEHVIMGRLALLQ